MSKDLSSFIFSFSLRSHYGEVGFGLWISFEL